MKQDAWCVLLRMCEGCMRRFGGCKEGGRKLEFEAWREERREISVCLRWDERGGISVLVCEWVRVCVCEVFDCFTYCRFSLKARTSTQENTGTRRGAIFYFLKLICPLSVGLHYSTRRPPPCPPWYRHKHTNSDAHTQYSSLSNESPEDLSDTNNSTQISVFSHPQSPLWYNTPVTLDHDTAFQSISSLSIPIHC